MARKYRFVEMGESSSISVLADHPIARVQLPMGDRGMFTAPIHCATRGDIEQVTGVLGHSPFRTGFAFLDMGAQGAHLEAIYLAAQLATRGALTREVIDSCAFVPMFLAVSEIVSLFFSAPGAGNEIDSEDSSPDGSDKIASDGQEGITKAVPLSTLRDASPPAPGVEGIKATTSG